MDSGDDARLDFRVDAAVPTSVIWVHTAGELYSFDPGTNSVEWRGRFTPVRTVTDIAIHSDGSLFAMADDGRLWRARSDLLSLDRVSPTLVPAANSLTFMPPGTLSPAEVMVLGFGGLETPGGLLMVELSGYEQTRFSMLPDECIPSGDVVFVPAAGAFVSMFCDSDYSQDYLGRIDLMGGPVEMIGPMGVPSVWGLAFWEGTVYGFTAQGLVISVDAVTGEATVIAVVPGAPQFWGAAARVDTALKQE